MTLHVILSNPEHTPLYEVIHPFDLYGIALELSDDGRPVDWNKLTNCETVGDLAGLVGELVG